MTPDMAPVARSRADGIDFSFDNPAMLTPPKDAPARYQWQRIVEFTDFADWTTIRSEEHTSELQSLMRISYAVFCLKKKHRQQLHHIPTTHTQITPSQ